jgi:hypothetical protein
MPGRLIQYHAAAHMFLYQQKFAIAFYDGGHGQVGSE